jgi:hypothetical protein
MDLTNEIVHDGIQLTNTSVSYGSNSVYIKQLYVATGYWLEITKNITRFGDNNYSIDITVMNLGSSRTPNNQAVIVYNFLPNTFNLTSPFAYSSSTWYTTDETNDTLNDVEYNGTMFQFAITETNVFNSSLDIWVVVSVSIFLIKNSNFFTVFFQNETLPMMFFSTLNVYSSLKFNPIYENGPANSNEISLILTLFCINSKILLIQFFSYIFSMFLF